MPFFLEKRWQPKPSKLSNLLQLHYEQKNGKDTQQAQFDKTCFANSGKLYKCSFSSILYANKWAKLQLKTVWSLRAPQKTLHWFSKQSTSSLGTERRWCTETEGSEVEIEFLIKTVFVQFFLIKSNKDYRNPRGIDNLISVVYLFRIQNKNDWRLRCSNEQWKSTFL